MPSLYAIQSYVADIVLGFNNVFQYIIAPNVGVQMVAYAESLPADNFAGKGFIATAGFLIQALFGDASLFEMMLLGGFGLIMFWTLCKWLINLL